MRLEWVKLKLGLALSKEPSFATLTAVCQAIDTVLKRLDQTSLLALLFLQAKTRRCMPAGNFNSAIVVLSLLEKKLY